MIEKLDFVNLRNQTLQLNTATLPLREFTVDGETRSTDRPKMQDHGSWHSFAYLGPVVVHLEGDILCATTEDYITQRLNMLSTIVPPPGRQRDRKWGSLIIRYTGQTEDFRVDCRHEGYPEIPLQALSPSVSPFLLSFHCFEPFWTGTGTGRKVLI